MHDVTPLIGKNDSLYYYCEIVNDGY